MTLTAGVIVPHPPIVLPKIGGADLARVKATTDALKKASSQLNEIGPEILIFISPHGNLFKDVFIIRGEPKFKASFNRFGAPGLTFGIENDTDAVESIIDACRKHNVPLRLWRGDGGNIDWGVSVPYFYLGNGRPIVSLSISGLSYRDHFKFGEALRSALEPLEKSYAFTASGDLSHCLTSKSPYGFAPEGAVFDRKIVEIVAGARFSELLELDGNLIESACECGLRSIITLAGIFSNAKVETEVLSYEGPFGVGYLVGIIRALGEE